MDSLKDDQINISVGGTVVALRQIKSKLFILFYWRCYVLLIIARTFIRPFLHEKLRVNILYHNTSKNFTTYNRTWI